MRRKADSRYIAVVIIYIVTIISQAMTDDPRFAEPIPNVTVALGRDASLPCVVENLGTYKVAWIHIDRQMILTIHRHVISRIARFSVSHDNAKTWLLHVSSVQQEDRGYYMCQVNTNPMISQVGYLQVVVPPNIIDVESTQSTVAVRENQNISLTCKADGFPTPKIMWRREDGQAISVERRKKVNVYDGEKLNLTRISRTEMGAYLCIATNGVPPSVSKRIIVDVEFSPMIWVPNQLVGAPAGTDVTIDCHTEAYPRAISYWVYDNVMLLPTKKYGTETMENSYRAHMKLTVRNLQTGDFGNYRCISKNSLGETEGSIRLYEIPMPSAPPKATEMKSYSNKEYVSKRNVSRSVIQDEKPKVIMVSSSEKEIFHQPPEEDTGLGLSFPSGSQTSDGSDMQMKMMLQVVTVIFHYILSTNLFVPPN
ncbi:lachesin isoform X1 [Coccinella septempunctata]|uniref:lachesin isoform X1 n=1 Tax=Coccinella septempunctata TaxID=41139 RepID=UPI001D062E88|nr:lachesin isoform X1 [Coccinella septempunctata]XP_044765309.1 lachesin isoform X1 [Coccinella septempunctata]